MKTATRKKRNANMTDDLYRAIKTAFKYKHPDISYNQVGKSFGISSSTTARVKVTNSFAEYRAIIVKANQHTYNNNKSSVIPATKEKELLKTKEAMLPQETNRVTTEQMNMYINEVKRSTIAMEHTAEMMESNTAALNNLAEVFNHKKLRKFLNRAQ